MRIIISPAKKMNVHDDWSGEWELPIYVEQAECLQQYIRSLSREEAAKMWRCNEKLTELNYQRFQNMELRSCLTPALLAYEGIQYQYMAPSVFERDQWEYVSRHLRILSGFYGILRPADGVVPYRLEMQAKGHFPMTSSNVNGTAEVKTADTLYSFWKDTLYQALTEPGGTEILNLASKEYSKAVEPYLKPGDRYLTCVFGMLEKDQKGKFKVKVKATEAKMARGEMVRFMAEHQIENLENIKTFNRLGYVYQQELSDEKQYVFCKNS